MDHRDRLSPISLSREDPILQSVLYFDSTDSLLRQSSLHNWDCFIGSHSCICIRINKKSFLCIRNWPITKCISHYLMRFVCYDWGNIFFCQPRYAMFPFVYFRCYLLVRKQFNMEKLSQHFVVYFFLVSISEVSCIRVVDCSNDFKVSIASLFD